MALNFMQKVLLDLLPSGFAWPKIGNVRAITIAIADEHDLVRKFLAQIEIETNPKYSITEIDRWLEQVGVSKINEDNLPLKQNIASFLWSPKGGQNQEYLESILRAFNDTLEIIEDEPETFNYKITGVVDLSYKLNLIDALIKRFFPLHLTYQINVTILNERDLAICNVGICGRAVCGRVTSLIDTSKTATAVCGIAVCGRSTCGTIEDDQNLGNYIRWRGSSSSGIEICGYNSCGTP